jgi:hypothetical protein
MSISSTPDMYWRVVEGVRALHFTKLGKGDNTIRENKLSDTNIEQTPGLKPAERRVISANEGFQIERLDFTYEFKYE